MKRCYPINRVLRQIASTVPLQFEEVDFQMQLDVKPPSSKPPTWRIWLFDTCNCINITIKNKILLFYRVYNYKRAKIIRDENLRIV